MNNDPDFEEFSFEEEFSSYEEEDERPEIFIRKTDFTERLLQQVEPVQDVTQPVVIPERRRPIEFSEGTARIIAQDILDNEEQENNPPLLEPNRTEPLWRDSEWTNMNNITEQDWLNITRYNSEKIRPISDVPGSYLIKSSMDTYKSRTLRKWLHAKVEEGLSYVNVTFRTLLAINQHQEFLDAGIPDQAYHEKKFNPDSQCITIQAESLHRIRRRPDIVIFDEGSGVHRQMHSGLHKHLQKNREIYINLLKSATFLIIMDADLDDDIINFIHEVAPHIQINVEINEFKHPPKEYVICPDNQTMYCRMLSEFDKGKKLAIVSGTVNMANKIRKIIDRDRKDKNLPELVGQVYTSKDKDYPITDILNPNKEWLKYDYIIYTSVIGAGIDFHVPHFDKIFVFADFRGCSVNDHFQMIGRIRKIKDNEVFVTMLTKNMKFSTRCKDIHWNITYGGRIQNKYMLKHLIDFKHHWSKDGLSIWIPDNTSWYRSFIKLRQKRMLSQKHFRNLFIKKIIDGGNIASEVDTVLTTNDLAKQAADLDKELKIEIAKDEEDLYDMATILTDDQLKQKGDETTMDSFNKRKTYFSKIFKKVTGRNCYNYYHNKENFKTYIHRIQFERDFTPDQLHGYDINKKRYNVEYDPIAWKYDLVRKLNKIIGFNNSYDDQQSTRSSLEILEDLPKINNMRQMLYKIIKKKPPKGIVSDWNGILGLVKTFYGKWLGSFIETVSERKQINGVRKRVYFIKLIKNPFITVDDIIPYSGIKYSTKKVILEIVPSKPPVKIDNNFIKPLDRKPDPIIEEELNRIYNFKNSKLNLKPIDPSVLEDINSGFDFFDYRIQNPTEDLAQI